MSNSLLENEKSPVDDGRKTVGFPAILYSNKRIKEVPGMSFWDAFCECIYIAVFGS